MAGLVPSKGQHVASFLLTESTARQPSWASVVLILCVRDKQSSEPQDVLSKCVCVLYVIQSMVAVCVHARPRTGSYFRTTHMLGKHCC